MFSFTMYLAAVGCIVGIECSNKVKLEQVTALTLYKDEYTVGRRSKPILQLQCVRGSACRDSQPLTVQCYNRGFDGVQVQWECRAELSKAVVFGKIEVSCEGYDYPEDPYVLKGSCGLQYELSYVSGHASSESKETWNHSWFFWLLLVAVIGLFLFALVPSSASRSARGNFTPGSWDGGPPPPPHSGPYPPPPGFKTDAPPPYEEACGRTNTNETPGFWTGMGLGGIAGYLLANNTIRHRGTGDPSTSAFTRSSSSESRTTSGFGGTSRR